MQATKVPAVEMLHRLLFRAMLEMRSQGQEHQNKVVFHLADLFHNVVLEMANAAEGKTGYEEVLALLDQGAEEKGLGRWLAHNAAEIDRQARALDVTGS